MIVMSWSAARRLAFSARCRSMAIWSVSRHDETSRGRGAPPALLCNPHNGHFYARKRIAGAGRQLVDFQENGQTRIIDEVLKQRGIANLRRAFAADVNLLLLLDGGNASTRHPSSGTPP